MFKLNPQWIKDITILYTSFFFYQKDLTVVFQKLQIRFGTYLPWPRDRTESVSPNFVPEFVLYLKEEVICEDASRYILLSL